VNQKAKITITKKNKKCNLDNKSALSRHSNNITLSRQ